MAVVLDLDSHRGEIVASYADLTLGAPHGAEHDCFLCADARAHVGHRPLDPLFSRHARRGHLRVVTAVEQEDEPQ